MADWKVHLSACMTASRHAGRQVGRQAGRQVEVRAGKLAGQRVYVRTHLHSRKPTYRQTCWHSYGYNHSLNPLSPHSRSSFGQLRYRIKYFESRNNSTNSNPFAEVTRRLFGYCRKVAAARYVLSYSKPFGLLPESLAASCSSEVGQPEYRKRGYRFIPHILFACFSEKHLIPSWLANATTLLPREPVRKEQLLLPSPSISSEYS